MNIIISFLQTTPGRIILSIAVIVFLHLIRLFIIKTINRKVEKIRSRYIRRQFVNYFIPVIGIIVLLIIWEYILSWALGIIGIIAAAITIVVKELILNFIANIVIIGRGLFQVGDRVQVDNIKGDVMETGPLFFTLAEIGTGVNEDIATGKVVKVPNGLVLVKPLINYSKGRMIVYNEIVVQLKMSSNWKKAKEIGLKIISNNSYKLTEEDIIEIEKESEEMIFLHREPSVNVKLMEGKIQLILRYACKFHNKRESEFFIWEELLEKFSQENDIELYE